MEYLIPYILHVSVDHISTYHMNMNPSDQMKIYSCHVLVEDRIFLLIANTQHATRNATQDEKT